MTPPFLRTNTREGSDNGDEPMGIQTYNQRVAGHTCLISNPVGGWLAVSTVMKPHGKPEGRETEKC